MTHDEMIAVIAAHRDGKEIKARARGVEDDWYPCQTTGTFFNFRTYEYRIKPVPPKPREWWIVRGYDGMFRVHDSFQEGLTELLQVHVREVLPSTGEEPPLPVPNRNIILAWLGRWRSEIPHKAVTSLQDILGVPNETQ